MTAGEWIALAGVAVVGYFVVTKISAAKAVTTTTPAPTGTSLGSQQVTGLRQTLGLLSSGNVKGAAIAGATTVVVGGYNDVRTLFSSSTAPAGTGKVALPNGTVTTLGALYSQNNGAPAAVSSLVNFNPFGVPK